MADAQTQALGATLRTLREARGLSREEWHTRSGTSVPMIAKVERGQARPSPNTLARLATALGLTSTEVSRRANLWEAGAAQGLSTAELRTRTLTALPRPERTGPEEETPEWDAVRARFEQVVAEGSPEERRRLRAALGLDGPAADD